MNNASNFKKVVFQMLTTFDHMLVATLAVCAMVFFIIFLKVKNKNRIVNLGLSIIFLTTALWILFNHATVVLTVNNKSLYNIPELLFFIALLLGVFCVSIGSLITGRVNRLERKKAANVADLSKQ